MIEAADEWCAWSDIGRLSGSAREGASGSGVRHFGSAVWLGSAVVSSGPVLRVANCVLALRDGSGRGNGSVIAAAASEEEHNESAEERENSHDDADCDPNGFPFRAARPFSGWSALVGNAVLQGETHPETTLLAGAAVPEAERLDDVRPRAIDDARDPFEFRADEAGGEGSGEASGVDEDAVAADAPSLDGIDCTVDGIGCTVVALTTVEVTVVGVAGVVVGEGGGAVAEVTAAHDVAVGKVVGTALVAVPALIVDVTVAVATAVLYV